ncbi:MAG: helicase-related protein, partial [Candidatus Nanohaloarchaea archaeon]
MAETIDSGDKVLIDGEEAEVIRTYTVGDLRYVRAVIDGETRSVCLEDVSITKTSDETKLTDLDISDLDPLSGRFSAKKFDLRTEALQLRLAHEQNQLLSISNSTVRLEPYQLDCVNQVMSGLRQRALIADDVGLGKTIEAGLIFKELVARDRADKVIFVVPAHLQKKWKRDMKRFFDIDLTIADRTWVEAEKRRLGREANIWDQEGQKLLTSMSFLRQDEFRKDIEDSFWDLAIVDEAHKASKKGDSASDTAKTVETVSHRSDSLLLLSATPHDGKKRPFRSLISYIDPFLVPPDQDLSKSDIEDVMVRRGKDTIYDDNGERIFPDRDVRTVPVEITESEKEFYDEVTEYVKTVFNRSDELNEPAVGFAMALMQKRLVSSTRAIKLTLRRRLEDLLEYDESEVSKTAEKYLDGADLDDKNKEEAEKEIEKLTSAKNDEELEKEIRMLKDLVEKAEGLPLDSKARQVSEFIQRLLNEDPEEKIIIFTEYRDTLDHIVENVLGEEWKDEIMTIHGGVSKDERERIEAEFNYGDSRILVATDAASEGIDLQHSCSTMVNYELPWNPNKLEQRIGRIHRYGQDEEVKVWNFQLEGTRESEIFEMLEEKIENIRSGVGSTADMVGIMDDLDIEQLIMNSIESEEPPEATKEELEEMIENRQETLKEWYDRTPLDSTTFDQEDRKRIQQVVEESEEVYGSEEEIKDLFISAIENFGGKIVQTDTDIYRIEDSGDIELAGKLGEEITFNREKAMERKNVDLVSPDSDITQNLTENILRTDFGGDTGLKVLKSIEEPGIVFNYVTRFEDGSGEIIEEKVVPLYVNSESLDVQSELGKKVINSETLDKIPEKNQVSSLMKNKEIMQEKAEDYISKVVKNRREEIKKNKSEEIEERREKLDSYEEKELQRIQDYIDSYENRDGDDMEIAIRGQKARKEKIKQRLDERREELNKKEQIISIAPEVEN